LCQSVIEIEPGCQSFGLLAGEASGSITVFEGVDGDLDEITDLNFQFTSVKLSDFKPALTTTVLASMLTTSAVMTSPERISWCVRLSSKRLAKLSEDSTWDVMFMFIGP
jgi:hypothetical protein